MYKFLPLCIILFFTSACISEKPLPEYGLTLPSKTYPSLYQFATDINNRAKEFGDVRIRMTNSIDSQDIQNEHIDDLLSKNVCALAVALVDPKETPSLIKKAKALDVPLVFFHRPVLKDALTFWSNVYFVGSQIEEAGQKQGLALANYWHQNQDSLDRNQDGVLQYVLLTGNPDHPHTAILSETAITTLKEQGVKTQKLAEGGGLTTQQLSREKMEILRDIYGEKIEAILTHNDDLALGALDALTSTTLPAVIGIGGSPEALRSIKQNQLYATVLNDTKSQAYAIFDVMDALAKNKSPEDITGLIIEDNHFIWIPHVSITKENVEQFLR